jgi:hypothetical protein
MNPLVIPKLIIYFKYYRNFMLKYKVKSKPVYYKASGLPEENHRSRIITSHINLTLPLSSTPRYCKIEN